MTETVEKQIAKMNSAGEAPPPGKLSYEQFLEWADEDTLAEWVDGEIEMTSPANLKHQDISGFLYRVLCEYAEDLHDLGKVVSAPFQMKLPKQKGPGREPDLLFVKKAYLDRFKHSFLDGAANLVIEIVSPESIARDTATKFNEYQAGGVPEYWLIEPIEQRVTFYQLDEQKHYQITPPDNDGYYHSRELESFRFWVNWLWRFPLPQVNDVLLDIDGEGYARYQIEKLRQRGLLP